MNSAMNGAMSWWIAAVCALSLLASLLLLRRWRLWRGRLAISVLLQIAIWTCAWLLYSPPHWPAAASDARFARETIDSNSIASGSIVTTGDPRLFPQRLAYRQQVALTGDGLSLSELRDLPPLRLLTDGEVAGPAWEVQWPRRLTLGETLHIQLRPSAPFTTDTQLTLRNPFGSEIQRLEIAAGDTAGEFSLKATPKMAGRWLYELEIRQGEHSRREVIPVLVEENSKPAVLLWLARPSFETAALSRWLRQSGAPAYVATQLAPELLRKESLNGFELAQGKLLDPANRFDLLILDSQLWPSLTGEQKAQLQRLAARSSLLWLVGEEAPESFLSYARAQGMELRQLDSPPMSAGKQEETPQLAPGGYAPVAAAPADRLLRDADTTLYWGRSKGAAVQGFVLFARSYPWLTAGRQREYAQLWKTIFDRQLSLRGSELPVSIEQQLPLVEQRVSLCSALLADSQAKIAPLGGDRDQSEIPALREGLQTGERCAEFWPARAGWYRLATETQAFDFYVFAERAWPWWQRWIRHSDTQRMAAARLGPEPELIQEKQPLPLYWIALVLLALLSWSWWRERGAR